MTIADLPIHPAAVNVPPMSDEEFARLKADIAEHGFDRRFPIYTLKGHILDGRHRFRACRELGVAPFMVEWKPINGEFPVDFVDRSLGRRNLTPSQLAAYAALQVPFYAEKARERQREAGKSTALNGTRKKLSANVREASSGKASEEASKAVGAKPRYTEDAVKIQKEAPKVFEKVKSGELSIPAAKREVAKTAPPPPRESVTDPAGRTATEPLVRAALTALPRFKKLINECHALKREILALADEKHGVMIRGQQLETHFKSIVAILKFAEPYTTCPYYPQCKVGCKTCKGMHWVTEEVFNLVPREDRR